ncbi:MAG: HlyD family efflux transporter periplasmic adaptor subunit [Bryobacteraceae bacterium]|nr:HlyD family efflux transporter periplasmic adaptor subunit [Bryobacteraceae bacterium]
MKGKWLLLGGVLVMLAATGAAVWYARPPSATDTKAKAEPVAEVPAQANGELSLSGRVQATKLVQVLAPVDGVLEELRVKEGEDVAEGQLMARVKNAALDLGHEQAGQQVEALQSKVNNLEASLIAARLEAQRTRADADARKGQLEAARKEFDRQAMLMKEGATPRNKFEKSKTDYENGLVEFEAKDNLARQASDRVESLTRSIDDAKKALAEQSAEWEDAKAGLNSAEIHAPADGVVVKVSKQNGEALDKRVTEVFQIAVDLTAMEAVVSLNADELKLVKPGMAGVIFLVEAGNEPIPATVREIKANEAFLDFKSPNPAVRPGLIAQVRIPLK